MSINIICLNNKIGWSTLWRLNFLSQYGYLQQTMHREQANFGSLTSVQTFHGIHLFIIIQTKSNTFSSQTIKIEPIYLIFFTRGNKCWFFIFFLTTLLFREEKGKGHMYQCTKYQHESWELPLLVATLQLFIQSDLNAN